MSKPAQDKKSANTMSSTKAASKKAAAAKPKASAKTQVSAVVETPVAEVVAEPEVVPKTKKSRKGKAVVAEPEETPAVVETATPAKKSTAKKDKAKATTTAATPAATPATPATAAEKKASKAAEKAEAKAKKLADKAAAAAAKLAARPVRAPKPRKLKKLKETPSLSDKTGLNIPINKLKSLILNSIINDDEIQLLNAIDEAKTNKTPIKNLDPKLRETLDQAVKLIQTHHQARFARDKIKKLKQSAPSQYQKYSEKKKAAVKQHAISMKKTTINNRTNFNETEFNKSFDSGFYKSYKFTLDTEDWDTALEIIAKSKIRLSTSTRVILAAFVELVMQHVISKAIQCCGEAKSGGTVHIGHVFGADSEQFYTLKFISRFNAYQTAKAEYEIQETKRKAAAALPKPPRLPKPKRGTKPVAATAAAPTPTTATTPTPATATAPTATAPIATAPTPAPTATAPVVETPEEKQKHLFKFYINEMCRTIKNKYARPDMEKYSNIAFGKDFKEFCEQILLELITKLGLLLKNFVITSEIKTINETIMNASIQQIHILTDMDMKLTQTFIDDKVRTHSNYLINKVPNPKSKSRSNLKPRQAKPRSEVSKVSALM